MGSSDEPTRALVPVVDLVGFSDDDFTPFAVESWPHSCGDIAMALWSLRASVLQGWEDWWRTCNGKKQHQDEDRKQRSGRT